MAADGDVKYRFMADAESAQRVIAQLEKKYDDLERKIAAVARTSRRSAEDEANANDRAAAAVTMLAGRLSTIAGVVGTVTQAWSAWREEIEAAAEAEDKFGRKLVADLALSGDLMQGPQIQKFLQNMPGVTQEVAGASFFGVRGGAPTLDLQRAKDVATQVAGTQGFAFRDNLEQLTAAGELAGKLAELAPGKSAQDIADLTVAVQSAAGRNVDQLTSQGTIKGLGNLLSKGMDIESALAVAVRSMDVGLKAGSLKPPTEGDLQALGKDKVLDLVTKFRDSQFFDVSTQGLAQAAGLAPDDFVEFSAQAKLQANLRDVAAREEGRGALQQHALAEAGGPFERLMVGFGNFMQKWVHAPGSELLGTAAKDDSEQRQVEQISSEKLGQMVTLLQQIANQGQQNQRLPIQRNGQGE